ncbi:MAG TPA: hypothetical protein VFM05_12330 [Candidatus Saccharimonadales bacterium]|nr:hypothetical protein [Candidatus Saccharimonadales bacterium]
MKKKTEAALKAIGVFIAMNAVAASLVFILRWLGIKPGVDLRPMPVGTIWLSEIFMLILAIQYYRHKVKHD